MRAARPLLSRPANCAAAALWLALTSAVAGASEVVLYDDTTGLPGDGPLLTLCTNTLCLVSDPDVTEVRTAMGTRLTTTAAARAGYTNLLAADFPPLVRSQGIRLTFEVKVASETHSSDDRAGFSVIALAEDARGIELGFWEDRVWAQSDADFRRAETALIDTQATERRYVLELLGDRYRLSVDDALVLDGPVRDYSAAGLPYVIGSFVFFGDNTTRAAAEIEIGRLGLATGIAADTWTVPLPAPALPLIAAAALAPALRLSRRGRACAATRR